MDLNSSSVVEEKHKIDDLLGQAETSKPIPEVLKRQRQDIERLYVIVRNLNNRLKALEEGYDDNE